MAGSVAQRRAVAPAGGCTVFVKPMRADESATASAPARTGMKEPGAWNCRESRKSLVRAMERVVLRSVPRMAGRGCARGELMVWYSRMAAAPLFLICQPSLWGYSGEYLRS